MGKKTIKLSPYWARITKAADKILSTKIEELKKRTVDPDLCLTNDDKFKMTKREMELNGLKDIQQHVRKGDFAGKLWAVDAVMGEKPCLLFHR